MSGTPNAWNEALTTAQFRALPPRWRVLRVGFSLPDATADLVLMPDDKEFDGEAVLEITMVNVTSLDIKLNGPVVANVCLIRGPGATEFNAIPEAPGGKCVILARSATASPIPVRANQIERGDPPNDQAFSSATSQLNLAYSGSSASDHWASADPLSTDGMSALVEGSENLVSRYGYWPTFHDGRIVGVQADLRTGDLQIRFRYSDHPALEVDLARRNEILTYVTLIWSGIDVAELAIHDFHIYDSEWRSSAARPIVHIKHDNGGSSYLRSRSVRVEVEDGVEDPPRPSWRAPMNLTWRHL